MKLKISILVLLGLIFVTPIKASEDSVFLSMMDTILLKAEPFGAYIKSAKWNKPGWSVMTTKELTVCWENLSDSSTLFRKNVQDTVEETWAFYSLIRFKGWGNQCPNEGIDIRIAIGAEPETKYLGKRLQGVKNGMTLQTDFSEVDYCKSKPLYFCERAAAVHEFGHALSLTHEQNREDAKPFCKGEDQGDYPDAILTDYDPDSIMNYCNKDWNNDGLLSEKDIQSIIYLYGGAA